jgi:hypothetical protein
MIMQWRQAFKQRLDAALLSAVCREQTDLARCLLGIGADPNAVGWCVAGLVSPLSAACVRENLKLVRLLLAWGADADGNLIESSTPSERLDDEFASDAKRECSRLITMAHQRESLI